MSVELTEALLRQAAGWEVMKRARACLDQGQVLSSTWSPPRLHGVVRSGPRSLPAAMQIRSAVDMDNECPCRDSREWGKLCVHSVAVGLHWLQTHPAPAVPAPAISPTTRSTPGPPAPRVAAAPSPPAPARTLPCAPDGEPAELALIFPPQLEPALARGRIQLAFEALAAGRRRPLNALPNDRTYSFAPQDLAVLERLHALTGGETPAVLALTLAQLADLLPSLVDHPRLTLGRDRSLTVTAAPLALPLRATLEPEGQIQIALAAPPPPLVFLGDWVWLGNAFQPLGLAPGLRAVLQAPLQIPRPHVPDFLTREWPRLQAAGHLATGFDPSAFVLEPLPPRFHLTLTGGLAHLTAQLEVAYGPHRLPLGGKPVTAPWLPDPSSPTRYFARQPAAEQDAFARLRRRGFSAPDAHGSLALTGQDNVLEFFARDVPRLQAEWEVVLEERLARSTSRQIERIEPQFQITPSGEQWFDLGVVFRSTSGETFSPADIQRLLLSGHSHTRLRNGKVALLDTGAVEEWQAVLQDAAPQQHAQGYRLPARQAGFVTATLAEQPGWRVQAPPDWHQRTAPLTGCPPLDCPPLGPLDAVLRPYQKEGIAWLRFLRAQRFGGILADEMGLGKTLQTLALLQWARQQEPGLPPMLVVCPTSLVFNWVAEATRFTPRLTVLPLHGPERHARFDRIPSHDLVITSYALIRRDADVYRAHEFDTVILDEAQHIKNRQTQNAQAVKAIRARHRLVLTGTPLENSVLDLWSIFDFLMPGYLGSARDFRERYELPITRDQDPPTQARLARRLRPFLLRRLKRDVAADLPDKIEQIAYCDLTPPQRQLYQQVLEASRHELLAAVGAAGLARSRLVILNALLRLRQVCCDLRLLPLESPVPPADASGKLDLFAELLAEVLDGGHRVLVFSQFVRMLTLLREHLEADGLPYCYLDGDTRDRGAVVQRFQEDAAIPVFLISLKAGGTGLNLTGADTVIHFDPWWNPAVEDQATDRAHRLGQTRLVTSYKLIARDTVEEKILRLQNRKREVTRATLGTEAEFAASLTAEELQDLLG